MTDTEIDGLPAMPGGGRRKLAGATLGMAIGTTLSRITGVARVIAQTTALGGAGFADGYNLANTTPNIITDIVIGGVLSATFVPVFVDHLSTRRTEEAWRAIFGRGHRHRRRHHRRHRRLLRPGPRDHPPLHGGKPQRRRGQPAP